ncbi:fumarate reductase flavoprotein subunit [Proteus mirabilis]|uniref:Fumarate reductase flavoprotein subunit n=1 Tax=Proteus mirabilis TaxID=584 RepID=A0A379FK97_PROMI|nr:fumarate reductase flavoprotein subunit [Proteus mirabilis]
MSGARVVPLNSPCDVVHLDLRHLGAKKLHERLPFICELAKAYVGVDPVNEPIPVRPTAHYTMGGIETNQPHRNTY